LLPDIRGRSERSFVMHGTEESVAVAEVHTNPGGDRTAATWPEAAPSEPSPPTPESVVASQSSVAMAMLKSHELAEDRRRLLEAEKRLVDAERQESLARERELARFD